MSTPQNLNPKTIPLRIAAAQNVRTMAKKGRQYKAGPWLCATVLGTRPVGVGSSDVDKLRTLSTLQKFERTSVLSKKTIIPPI